MRVQFAALTYLVIASVVAQTPASPAVAPLEEAKRELEATKGGRIKEGEGGLRDLRAAVPPMPLPAAPVAPPPKSRIDPRSGSDRTGRNWLVEAMEKKPGATGVRAEEKLERSGRELIPEPNGFKTEGRERGAFGVTRSRAWTHARSA